MKKVAATILLILIIAQSFYSATIYIWYQVNREYITQAFCVNKNRPQLKCNGQCYLAKQLQEAEERNPPQQLKEWLEINAFEPVEPITPPTVIRQQHSYGMMPEFSYSHLHPTGIFHPPLS